MNGEKLDAVALHRNAQRSWAASTASGIADMVENRLVGMKIRGVYETPGGTILYDAHEMLETHLPGPRHRSTISSSWRIKFAELVYYGQWYTPLREALSAFVDKTQETVTGTVQASSSTRATCIAAGVTSPLFPLRRGNRHLRRGPRSTTRATRAGFINLFGLPIKVKADGRRQEREAQEHKTRGLLCG